MQPCYKQLPYVLNLHSAVEVTAAKISVDQAGSHIPHISLLTAHLAKFSEAVKLALTCESSCNFEDDMLTPELISLAKMEKRCAVVENSWQVVREIVKKQVAKDISTCSTE